MAHWGSVKWLFAGTGSRGQRISVRLDLHVSRHEHLQHTSYFGGSKSHGELPLNLDDHFPKSNDRRRAAVKRSAKRLVLFPCRPIADEVGHCGNMGKALAAGRISDGPDETFRPFGRCQLAESLPGLTAPFNFVTFDCPDFSRRVESTLPTLATDRDDRPVAFNQRMIVVCRVTKSMRVQSSAAPVL